MTRGDFLRSLFRIFASPGSCLAAALIVSTPASSAVFSDYPAKFHDPRFAVTAADQIHMLAPIGHATTMEPVPLEDADGDPMNSVNRKSGMTAGSLTRPLTIPIGLVSSDIISLKKKPLRASAFGA
jgi:hypothetical protein